MRKLFVIILLISSLYFLSVETANHADEKSPYYQHLPDCSKREYKNVTKQTSIKGIVCPMVKDEVGFLSEWIAFYEMQGFNHVILYDNNSTLPINEVQPWIDMGFVTIRRYQLYIYVNFFLIICICFFLHYQCLRFSHT
jgi:hypothetical protein